VSSARWQGVPERCSSISATRCRAMPHTMPTRATSAISAAPSSPAPSVPPPPRCQHFGTPSWAARLPLRLPRPGSEGRRRSPLRRDGHRPGAANPPLRRNSRVVEASLLVLAKAMARDDYARPERSAPAHQDRASPHPRRREHFLQRGVTPLVERPDRRDPIERGEPPGAIIGLIHRHGRRVRQAALNSR